MIPLKLSVLQRLTALLEQAAGPDESGQPYNLQGQVFRGRVEFGEETTLPALSILEAPMPDPGIFGGEGEMLSENWTLLIQGWAKDDKSNPSDPAYYLASAVSAQLGRITATRDDASGRPLDPVTHLLGGTIIGIEVGGSVVRPLDAKTSSRAFFYLPIRIRLANAVSDPYLPA